MSKLPFAVSPRLAPRIELIGSEESGKVQIERRGYLTSGEKAFVQQILQQDNSTLALIDLARTVARTKGYGLQESYNYVVQCITGEITDESHRGTIEELGLEFSSQIDQTLKGLTVARSRESIIYAACMLIHRIDASMDVNDVMELHPDIIEGLAALYSDEEAKSTARLMDAESSEAEPSVEQIEKKQRGTRSK
jgi:hypothetical protein